MKFRTPELFFAAWLFCVFIVFAPLPIYPVFFGAFSLTYAFWPRKEHYWNGQLTAITLCFLVLAAMGVISHFTHEEASSVKYLYKLLINFGFLAASVAMFRSDAQVIVKRMNWLESLLLGILVLSALQVAKNAIQAGMILTPFEGRINSDFADHITSPGVLFGISEKNMWALKLAFTFLALIMIRRMGLSQLTRRLFLVGVGAGVFCVVWTFSRTAQILVLLPAVYFVLHMVFSRSSYSRRIVMGIFVVPILCGALYLLYTKLFAVSLNVADGDGFATRLVIWAFFFRLLPDLNLWTGNGLLFGKNVLPSIDRFEIYFHNVFMDVTADYGLIGLAALLLLYWQLYFRYPERSLRSRLDVLICLFLPMFIAVNSQAMFMEVDIVIFMALSVLLREAQRLQSFLPENSCPSS